MKLLNYIENQFEKVLAVDTEFLFDTTKTIPEKPSIYFDLLYIATPGNEKKSKKKYKVQLFSRKDIPKRRKRKGVLPRHDVDIDWDECNEQGEKLLQKWYKEHGDDAYMDLSDVFDEYEY